MQQNEWEHQRDEPNVYYGQTGTESVEQPRSESRQNSIAASRSNSQQQLFGTQNQESRQQPSEDNEISFREPEQLRSNSMSRNESKKSLYGEYPQEPIITSTIEEVPTVDEYANYSTEPEQSGYDYQEQQQFESNNQEFQPTTQQYDQYEQFQPAADSFGAPENTVESYISEEQPKTIAEDGQYYQSELQPAREG